MNEEETKDMFINPFYAVNISPSFSSEHEPMVSKEKWVQVNSRMIDEMGKDQWLKRLLDVLEGK